MDDCGAPQLLRTGPENLWLGSPKNQTDLTVGSPALNKSRTAVQYGNLKF